MKFFSFLAGFFQDQNSGAENGGSRKALALYICLFFLWPFIQAGAQGIAVNETVFYGLLAIILFTLGAITSEFFSNRFLKKDPEPPKPPTA
jgi:hypothetical protein